MKKIILILAVITLLSCEKEKVLIPIEGELKIWVENKVLNGAAPTGFEVEYKTNSVLTKDSFEYVGRYYVINYSTPDTLYFKASNNHECMINVIVTYQDTIELINKKELSQVVINEILYLNNVD